MSPTVIAWFDRAVWWLDDKLARWKVRHERDYDEMTRAQLVVGLAEADRELAQLRSRLDQYGLNCG